MDINQVVELLGRTEVFGALDETARRQVAVGATRTVFARGQTIFVQEEPGDRMFVLARGAVKLVVRSRHGEVVELARHWPPAVFGQIALLDGGPRSASAEALEPSLLIGITRDKLIELLRSDPRLVDGLLRSLGELVRRANRQTTDLVFLDLQGRVARKLLELAEAPGANGGALRQRQFTQTELAHMVGGARQTVNLALRSLEERGLIRVSSGSIEILELEALHRRVEA
ncbi:MAG TPA: Crp/Fnr family transcriptional regulator [Actinomycetes bacterium]|jgi:CRP-like cAMP-binding protein|nr:Crp/Fnr family transcriptional regulator [Actinomycetes bacterium]